MSHAPRANRLSNCTAVMEYTVTAREWLMQSIAVRTGFSHPLMKQVNTSHLAT